MNKKLGRNEKCWCGSGKKFKWCHLEREAQIRPTKQEAFKRFIKEYNRGRCLHPAAGFGTCSHKIISAHAIQRRGGLSLIARQGHVYSHLSQGVHFHSSKWSPNSKPGSMGIGNASTFRGFCSRHDDELFAPIEKDPFKGTAEQIALLGYRAICNELLAKEFNLCLDNLARDFDKGEPTPYQQLHQHALTVRDLGVNKSIDEIRTLKSHYEEMLLEKNFNRLGYYVVSFHNTPEVMCSGIAQATHDFQGKKIDELGHLEIPANWLAFSLIATDDGGAAIFSWPTDHRQSYNALMTLNDLTDADQPHAIIRFTFEFFENTYFSPDWWDGLERQVQMELRVRQLRELPDLWGNREYPRPNDCLMDDGVRAVCWSGIRRLTSI